MDLQIKVDRAWFIAPDRSFCPILPGEPEVTAPLGAQMIVECGDLTFQVDVMPRVVPGVRLKLSSGVLRVSSVMRDWYATGLSHWWTASMEQAAITVQVRYHQLPSLACAVWIEPFPSAARSAICLTDHADHDDVEKLRPLVALLTSSSFHLTKSVFPQSEPLPEQGKYEPGLDDRQFRVLMRELHASGSEIAYHSFGPRPRVPTLDEARECATLMEREFGASTYIDHGRGEHNFAYDNELEPGLGLSDFLADFGVRNYWSHFDIYENPFHPLSSWMPVGSGRRRKDLGRSIALARTRDARLLAYLALHGVNNVVGAEASVRVRSVKTPRALAGLHGGRRELRAKQARPILIYRTGGEPATLPTNGIAGRDQWVFDTVLLNHLGWQLRPEAVDELVAEAGLLLGHCYLGATSPYMEAHTLKDGPHGWQVDGRFRSAVEHIAELQKRHLVISTTFEELRETLTRFATTSLIRHEDGWEVHGLGGGPCAAMSHEGGARYRLGCSTARNEARGAATVILDAPSPVRLHG